MLYLQLVVQGLTSKIQQAAHVLEATTNVQEATALCDMIRACSQAISAAKTLL
jgi:hypothetical protein